MNLTPKWQDILVHAWSVRLMALAAALTGLEVAAPYLSGLLPIPTGLFAALSGLCSAAALVARVIAQKEITPPAKDPFEEPFGDVP